MADNSSNQQFAGFPARMQFTPIPNVFLNNLLPQINDLAELKVTLHVFGTLYRRKGYPRFVTIGEMLGDRSLQLSLGRMAEPVESTLRKALTAAGARGTLLSLVLDRDGETEELYFLNDEAGRQAIARIQQGELALPGLKTVPAAPAVPAEVPDIFTLYEQNIGMLTPMIAEELRAAVQRYPENWLREAIKESVDLNKRNWRYIAAILERWSTEGRGSGTYQRDSKKADPDKYTKGRYGHLVQH